MPEYSFEIVSRPFELGGGWRLRLLEDGEEMGGGVFPLAEYAQGDGEKSALKRALTDAMDEADAWLASRGRTQDASQSAAQDHQDRDGDNGDQHDDAAAKREPEEG